MQVISDKQLEEYRQNGLLTGVRILDSSGTDEFRRRFDALEQEEGPEETAIGLVNRHLDVEFIWELAVHPSILDAVEAVIGPDILLLASQFFCKYGPDEVKFVAWHQDVTYWGLEPPEAITAWYAVDDSDAENGCMRAIPGSHSNGIREHGESGKGGNLLSINQELLVSAEEEASAVDMPLRAGEISLHEGALIHGSLPNCSTRRRSGLTLRYIRPSVRQVKLNSMGKMYQAILVRGEDKEKNFGAIEQPFPILGGIPWA